MVATVGVTVCVRIRNSVSDGTRLYKQGREYHVSKEQAAVWIRNGDAFILPGGQDVHFSIERAIDPPDAETGLAVPAVQAAGERAPERPKRKPRPRRTSARGREVGGAMSSSQAF